MKTKKYNLCEMIFVSLLSVMLNTFTLGLTGHLCDKPEEMVQLDTITLSRPAYVYETVTETDLVEEPEVTDIVMIEYEEPTEPEYSLTQEEIDLIARLVMAEAEGESEYGQRLVIDVILNRVDHPAKYMPDTVTEVIYQPSQFSPMWNGRFDRCYVKPEIVELVKEELISRTNYDVIFFRTNHYSQYGTPMFQEGAHYFSSL
jgi:spore germination cell wall hydrolase CwlJ-like protein